MNVLALDLGTATGWAHNFSEDFRCGTVKLISDSERKTAKLERMDRRRDMRVQRLFDFITAFKGLTDAVVFEDVEFSSYRLQVQLWSSLRAAVWLAFPHALVECVPVGTLKKFATGSGAADKDAMTRALVKQDLRFTQELRGKKQITFFHARRACPQSLCPALDDNAVDAVWLHKWAQKNLSRI